MSYVIHLVVLIVLLTNARISSGATAKLKREASDFSSDLYESTCTDERCNDVVNSILKNANKDVDPCGDFYGHICTGKEGKKFDSISKDMQDILEEALSDAKKEMKSLTVEKTLYQSCIEQKESEHRTKQKFTRILELSNGLSLFGRGKFGSIDWQTIDNFYASLGFEHAFFDVHVIRDPEGTDVNHIALKPPSPLFMTTTWSMLKYNYFSGIMSHLDGNSQVLNSTDYEDVKEFSNALFMLRPPLMMLPENTTTLTKNKMTIEKWQEIFVSGIDLRDFNVKNRKNNINWFKLLNRFFKIGNVRLDKKEKIIIQNIGYFTKLAQLLQKTSPILIEKFIHFKFLAQVGRFLSPSMVEYFIDIKDRSDFCTRQTDNQLVGATYEFIRRHVSHENKLYAAEVVTNVKNALIYLIADADWMDEQTKSYAINKLKKLDFIMGYPDWQIDEKFINDYYGNLVLHSNFFENVIKYKRQILHQELSGLKRPRVFNPTTMSKRIAPLIYYFEADSYLNRIYFPTEYLHKDRYNLFSDKLPRAVNYGSFGSMLGTILYDYASLTDSLRYNEFSRTVAGMTKETINAYKIKEKCISHQLKDYKRTTSRFNGALASVINQDTVQIDKIYEKQAGLLAAFNAYNEVESQFINASPQEYDNQRDLKLFFLSYAKRICEIGDIYDEYVVYETSLKINAVVSNIESFSRIFACPSDSPMNKKTKCHLFV